MARMLRPITLHTILGDAIVATRMKRAPYRVSGGVRWEDRSPQTNIARYALQLVVIENSPDPNGIRVGFGAFVRVVQSHRPTGVTLRLARCR